MLTRSGDLVPRPPVLAGVLLVVMAGLVLWLARPVRRYLQGRATTSLDPLRAARTVVLAQAAALTGSAAAGWYAGQLVVVLTDLSLVANRSRILPLALLLGGRAGAGDGRPRRAALVPRRPARRGRGALRRARPQRSSYRTRWPTGPSCSGKATRPSATAQRATSTRNRPARTAGSCSASRRASSASTV